MVKVSVIIPVYNSQKYLPKMLESICRQTLKEIEIICVDDGSTDGSLQILQEYADKDGRMILQQQEHAGAGVARNTGMKLATGKFLSILDADDFFELNMLEEAYKACEKSHADVCVFRSDCFHAETERYRKTLRTIEAHMLPEKNPFTPQDIYHCAFQIFNGWSWDKLYRRELVVKSGLWFQGLRTTNDAFFVFLMNLQAGWITTIDQILAHHRVNVKTSLSVTREKSWECCWEAVAAIQKELQARGQYESVEQSFLNWALCFLLWNVHSMKTAEAKRGLYNKLREEYFPQLELGRYPESFFSYDLNAYEEYKNICRPNGMRKMLQYIYIRIKQKIRNY